MAAALMAATLATAGCASKHVHVTGIERSLVLWDDAVIPDDGGALVVNPFALGGTFGSATCTPADESPMVMLDVGHLPAPLTGWAYRAWFLPALDGTLDDLLPFDDGSTASVTLMPDPFGNAHAMAREPDRSMDWHAIRGVWVTVELESATAPAPSTEDATRPANLLLVGVHPPAAGAVADDGHQHAH